MSNEDQLNIPTVWHNEPALQISPVQHFSHTIVSPVDLRDLGGFVDIVVRPYLNGVLYESSLLPITDVIGKHFFQRETEIKRQLRIYI